MTKAPPEDNSQLAKLAAAHPDAAVGITFVVGAPIADLEAHAAWQRARSWTLGLYGHANVHKDGVNGAMNGKAGACKAFATELRALVGAAVRIKAVRPFSYLHTMASVACAMEDPNALAEYAYDSAPCDPDEEDEDPALAEWHPPLASVYRLSVEILESEAPEPTVEVKAVAKAPDPHVKAIEADTSVE